MKPTGCGDERATLSAAMGRYAEGDSPAFSTLYDLLAPRLHRFFLSQSMSHNAADDFTQQTLLKIHLCRARYVPGSDVLPWAYAIARRLCIDAHRKVRHEKPEAPEAATDAPDELVAAHQLETHFRERVQELPESQRVAWQLIREEGLSLREAAEALGTTTTAIKLRVHRASLFLKQELLSEEASP